MKTRLEATPDRLPESVLLEVATLDKLLFSGDEAVKPAGCYWWIMRDDRGKPIGFAGLRPCKHESNKGLAYMIRAGVRSKHRGKGLQKDLIRARVRLAKRKGFKEVVTYVMDWNLASANNLIACGFRLYTPSSLYGGKTALYFRRVL